MIVTQNIWVVFPALFALEWDTLEKKKKSAEKAFKTQFPHIYRNNR